MCNLEPISLIRVTYCRGWPHGTFIAPYYTPQVVELYASSLRASLSRHGLGHFKSIPQ